MVRCLSQRLQRVRVQSVVQMAGSQKCMRERWIMHIKRAVHLLTFRHTAYLIIKFFCRPFRGSGREHRKTSDKPPPAGAGSRDGLLYVFHAAGRSPLRCAVGRVSLYGKDTRSLARCRSPPIVREPVGFLERFGG